MSQPTVVCDIGSYTLSWPDAQVCITVTNVRTHSSDGRITGVLKVETTDNKLLHSPSQFNFHATRSRSELAKRLTDRMNHVDWYSILEQCATEIITRASLGEPVIELETGEDVEPPKWLLKPILLESLPTILFGDRGSAKSTLALAWVQVMQLPWYDNPLNLEAPENSIRTLYLDWEVSANVLRWQAKKLQEGMSTGPFSQFYRHMSRPLAADIEAVRAAITQSKAQVIIIDSLGPAAGGDLNLTQPALEFFSALSQLRVTSLILAHTAKHQSGKRSVFGSVFYENEARNIWEVRALQEPGEDTLEVGLFHAKPLPFSGRLKPFGYKLSFTETTTAIAPHDPAQVREFTAHMGTQKQIEQYLLEEGQQTIAVIAEALNLSTGAAGQALKRLKSKNKATAIKSADGWKWCALENQ